MLPLSVACGSVPASRLSDRFLSTVPLVSHRGSLPRLCLPERRLLKPPLPQRIRKCILAVSFSELE